MKRILKSIGIGLASLLGLLVIAVAVMALLGGRKLSQEYVVEPDRVAVENDAAVLERGQYLASISCAGCHGSDLGGSAFFEDPALGTVPAPNLTSGQGGAAAVYSDADFVRAIRHGVSPDGKALMVMPAAAFWHYSDADLAAVIAYVRSVPPVENELGGKDLTVLGKALVGAGVLDVLAAEHIDHTGPRPAAPAQQVDATYGEYLVNVSDCRNCHGPALTGAKSSEPGAPPAPSLSADGELAGWTTDEFIATLRTGTTPDGRPLNPAFMPWPGYGRMTDDDLTAVFQYLQSLPSAAAKE